MFQEYDPVLCLLELRRDFPAVFEEIMLIFVDCPSLRKNIDSIVIERHRALYAKGVENGK